MSPNDTKQQLIDRFQRTLSKGPEDTQVRDRFDRPLMIGDFIALNIEMPPINAFEIIDAAPNLAPNAPPNTITLRLMLPFNMIVPRGQAVNDLVRTVSMTERQAAVAQAAGGAKSPIAITDADRPASPREVVDGPDPRD